MFPFDFPAITVTLSGVSFRIASVVHIYIAAYLRANIELWQRLVWGICDGKYMLCCESRTKEYKLSVATEEYVPSDMKGVT